VDGNFIESNMKSRIECLSANKQNRTYLYYFARWTHKNFGITSFQLKKVIKIVSINKKCRL